MKIQTIHDFLALFPAQPRRKAGNGWLVICPTHSDKNPSLWVTPSKNPDFIADWTCQAGCLPEAVLSAKGLTWDDMRCNSHKPSEVVRRQEYTIRNASGELIATHIRLEYDNGEKSFLWERNGVSGLGGLKVADLPLFNSEKISKHLGNDLCVICEGEKPAAALENLGILSLGTVTGASSAPDVEALRPVAERSGPVYLWADNDTPGKSHMEKIASRLQALGKPCGVINWVEAPAQGDAADFVASGGTRKELGQLASQAPEWTPPEDKNKFTLTTLTQLLAEPEEMSSWLWDKTLPIAGLSILVSKPKVGKTTLARNLALKVARGDAFLGRDVTLGPVVYLALEEKRAEVAAHFARMEANDERILIHTGSAPQEAIAALKAAITQTEAVLAIVDPLFRMVRIRDGNDYAEVTRALEPLLMLARETGCHILTLHHSAKSEREGGDGILGSTALFGSVDTALIMKRRESERTLESIQRYGLDIPRTLLTFDSETGLTDAAGTVDELDMQRLGDEILQNLEAGELTEKEIRDAIGGNTGLVGKALRKLLAENEVTREGSGRRGDPFKYTKILVSSFTIGDKQEKQVNEKVLDTNQGETSPPPSCDIPDSPTAPCHNCGCIDFWLRKASVGEAEWLCSRCHPKPEGES